MTRDGGPEIEQYDEDQTSGRRGYRVSLKGRAWDVSVRLDPANLRYDWRIENAQSGQPEFQAGEDDLHETPEEALQAAVRFLQAQAL